MKKIIILLIACFTMSMLQAQVTLYTDFTKSAYATEAIPDIWDVTNRTKEYDKPDVFPGLKVNTVRIMGGVKKTVNGVNVPDLAFDPCTFNETTQKYEYNWQPLLSRISAFLNQNIELYQIVLDQPPWCFQRGYTFIPEGQFDGVHFREDEKMTTYGNSLPPDSKEAYADFIKAMMQKLIDTYGAELVKSWRFRVGSEIETPEHWKGTEQDFIAHFANTVQAVRAVLPDATVGLHTRPTDFLYKNGTIKNYKGEIIKSFANGLIEYCYDHNIKYDFWGISDYIIIGNASTRKVEEKYDELFGDLVNHPKWNQNATLSIMEFLTITAMNAPDGHGPASCMSTHTAVINVALSKMAYEKGLTKIHRWFMKTKDSHPEDYEAIIPMVGKIRYENNITGSPANSKNQIDAIFAKSNDGKEFDALIYNYNSASFNYVADEDVSVVFNVDFPVGTKLYYRSAIYSKEQNKLQKFLDANPNSVLSGWDKYSPPGRALTDDAYKAYEAFTNYSPYQFTEWSMITTSARTDGGEGSMVSLDTKLPSFAFKKYEFSKGNSLIEGVNPPQRIWSTNEDFEQFTTEQMTTTIDNDLLNISNISKFPKIIYNEPMFVDPYGKFRIKLKNETESQRFWFVWYKNGQKYQINFKPGINETDFHTYTVDLSSSPTWSGTIESFNIEVANKVEAGTVVIDSMELMLKEGIEEHTLSVDSEGAGFVLPAYGTAYTGQSVEFSATPNAGWKFIGWTGDVNSTDNPLDFIVTKNITLKAIFEEQVNAINNVATQSFKVYPNPSKEGVFHLQKKKEWVVYSISGQKILSGNSAKIDLSGYNKGVYLLKTERGSSFKLCYL